jgi:hypothetical protein
MSLSTPPRPMTQPDLPFPFTFSPVCHFHNSGADTPPHSLLKPALQGRARSTLASFTRYSRRSSPGRTRQQPRLCYSRYSVQPGSRSSLRSPPRRENQSIESVERVISECGETRQRIAGQVQVLKTERGNPFTSLREEREYQELFHRKGVSVGGKRVISRADYANFFDSEAKARYLSRNLAVTHFVNHKMGRPQPWRQLKASEDHRHARIFLAWNGK